MAEARILEDKDADPIIPRRQDFQPLRAPGQHKHFALVGYLDLNNEGQNDHQTVRNLISLNGGVIDCEGDENGKQQGRITVDTNYLILGEQPGEKGQSQQIAVYGRMRADAERLQVRVLSLAELKQQMGYRNELLAKKYGPIPPVRLCGQHARNREAAPPRSRLPAELEGGE